MDIFNVANGKWQSHLHHSIHFYPPIEKLTHKISDGRFRSANDMSMLLNIKFMALRLRFLCLCCWCDQNYSAELLVLVFSRTLLLL